MKKSKQLEAAQPKPALSVAMSGSNLQGSLKPSESIGKWTDREEGPEHEIK